VCVRERERERERESDEGPKNHLGQQHRQSTSLEERFHERGGKVVRVAQIGREGTREVGLM